MHKIIQALIGGVFGVLGLAITAASLYIMYLAKAPTMSGVILTAVGLGVLFWGGVMVPNSGVEDGGHTLTVLIQPWLDYLPGGRRKSDPPITPKDGAS